MQDTLFDTPIGRCAIAWEGERVAALHLPEGSDAATIARLRERIGSLAGEPPPWLVEVTGGLARALAGDRVELAHVGLADGSASPFVRKVYELARRIPPGSTMTYGELAHAAGSPGAARAVGQAMARNPFPLLVPCHRVVAADGSLTGYSGAGGVATKARILASERGVRALDPVP